MPRVMCVHFPHWNLQRIRRQRSDLRARPLAITRLITGKGTKVIECCERARRYRVRPGMMMAEALSMLPTLASVEEDLDADRQALIELAEWAHRYSPIVGLEDAIAPTCLLIDITGGADCFGGEEALLSLAQEEFDREGWLVEIAIADTIGAAWAEAVEGSRRIDNYQLTIDNFQLKESAESIVNSQLSIRNCQCIESFPIAALRLSPNTVALLAQLGIARIGQLLDLPRDQIAERFGPEVGWRLDQMTGHAAEVITPIHPCEQATTSWTFDDPVDRHEIVLKVLDILLERLQAILEKRHLGARLIECVLEPDGALAQRFECSLSRPARTANYLAPLMRLKFEQVRVDAPVRAMSVRAVALERFADEQPSLFDAGSEAALAQLLDSLTSRLGKDAVTTAHFVADPQPELACRFDPAIARLAPADKRQELDAPLIGQRPLRLFTRPILIEVLFPPSPLRGRGAGGEGAVPLQRFHCAGVEYVIAHCQGPERIETGWWRGDDVQRDYYLVETTEGTRWWIFHRLDDGRWFLHGSFD